MLSWWQWQTEGNKIGKEKSEKVSRFRSRTNQKFLPWRRVLGAFKWTSSRTFDVDDSLANIFFFVFNLGMLFRSRGVGRFVATFGNISWHQISIWASFSRAQSSERCNFERFGRQAEVRRIFNTFSLHSGWIEEFTLSQPSTIYHRWVHGLKTRKEENENVLNVRNFPRF